MAQVVVLGEVLIDFFPAKGGTPESVGTFSRHLGGAPANVAVGLRRLGHQVALVSKVGDDPFGEFIASALDAEGVDTTHLRAEHRARTALAFVTRGAGGEREFLFYRRPCADELLTPEEVPEELISASSAFHFGSLSLTVQPARSATWMGLRCAREAGVLVSMDPNLRLSLWDSPEEARETILEALEMSDLVRLSHEEARFLTKLDDPAHAAAQLSVCGPSTVVITNAHSCDFHHLGRSGNQPGFSVRPVDTTGAGDAFMSGLLAWLLRIADDGARLDTLSPKELGEGVRFAHAAGALVTTSLGALPPEFSPEQIDRFMRDKG